MLTGSCLCGDIAFEIDGPVDHIVHCHCSMCRKFHGGPFATFGVTAPSNFRWRQGSDNVVRYRSSGKGWRNFCPRCGSAVPVSPEGGPFALVPLGNVAEDPGVRPNLHFFVGSKAPWHDIPDDLPRHDAWPPGFRPRRRCRGQTLAYCADTGRNRRQLPVRCRRLRVRRRAGSHGQLPLFALPACDERRLCHDDDGSPGKPSGGSPANRTSSTSRCRRPR